MSTIVLGNQGQAMTQERGKPTITWDVVHYTPLNADRPVFYRGLDRGNAEILALLINRHEGNNATIALGNQQA